MNKYLVIILIILSTTLKGQKDIFGYYSSNVASIGFFATKIELFSDSTFKYEFSGDLSFDGAKGSYSVVDNNIVILEFEKNVEEIDELLLPPPVESRPQKLLFKNNKLYFYDKEGNIVKKGQAMSRHKKFLIFGQRFMTTRKIYLKKRKENEKKWRY